MRNEKILAVCRSTTRQVMLSGTVFIGVVCSAVAIGQEQASDAILTEIVVTGSRLPQPNVEGSSPVSVISAADIQSQGVTQVEEMLNNLPQVFASQGGSISNTSSGTATVNLRNLGSDRTLVLVNGRRLPAGTPRSPAAPDLNQIPAALIERVEVLTGGASAVYGSDAVAGVVNFIMNDSFEGLKLDLNYGFFNHSNDSSIGDIVAARGFATPNSGIGSDGESFDASLLAGASFAEGRGNASVYIGYRKIEPLLQADRDYSACALASNANGFFCGGSGTGAPGRFVDLNSGADLTIADASGTLRPFTEADFYNYGPLNYYQRPDERYSFATFFRYDMSDSATLYTELSFHDDRTISQVAPSGLFGLITPVGCSNSLLTAAWVNSICTNNGLGPNDTGRVLILRRNVEGGGRRDDMRHSSYRAVVGVRGSIGDNWKYDTFAQYGTVIFQESFLNDISVTRARRAMDVIAHPVTGQPVCRSVIDGTDSKCVPYNIWSLGGVTPQALAYMQTPGFQRGDTQQGVISSSVSSDLGAYGWQLPTAAQGVGVAFGAEYRSESLSLDTDQTFATHDLFGMPGPVIGMSGAYHVMDLFAEAQVPLISGMPFAEQLRLTGSYRYSDYNTGHSTDTFGIGLDWAPIGDVKFRGSYQQAVRAANVVEMFQARGLSVFSNDRDPCAGASPTRSLAQCQRTGVTAAQYGTILDNAARQYNQIVGGNPNLIPETAKSTTFGVVFTPSFLDRFSMTVDYFNIKVEDQIATLSPGVTLTQCLETGNPLFCDLITRDSLGTLWATAQAQIIATNLNIATAGTSGYDVSLSQSFDMSSFGTLGLNLAGTVLEEFKRTPIPGLGSYDCAGLYGPTCGAPLPEWRHTLRASWTTPWDVDVSLAWRYFDAVVLDRTSSNALLKGASNPVDRKLGSRSYLDFALVWQLMDAHTVRLGVNNLLDKDPPLSSLVGVGQGNGNTYPQVYDAAGRYVFLGLSAKF